MGFLRPSSQIKASYYRPMCKKKTTIHSKMNGYKNQQKYFKNTPTCDQNSSKCIIQNWAGEGSIPILLLEKMIFILQNKTRQICKRKYRRKSATKPVVLVRCTFVPLNRKIKINWSHTFETNCKLGVASWFQNCLKWDPPFARRSIFHAFFIIL